MLTHWLSYPHAHTLYCTKRHTISVNGYPFAVPSWGSTPRAGASPSVACGGRADPHGLPLPEPYP